MRSPYLCLLVAKRLQVIRLLETCLFVCLFRFIFLERGRVKERERNINVWLSLARPLLGTWPATQACALDWELARLWFAGQRSTTEPHHPGLDNCSVIGVKSQTSALKVTLSCLLPLSCRAGIHVHISNSSPYTGGEDGGFLTSEDNGLL